VLISKKQFDFLDFLSFSGGLLGLFAGFSILSAVEVVYWIIFRNALKIIRKSSTKVHPFNYLKNHDHLKIKLIVEYMQESSIHGINYFGHHNYVKRYLQAILS
jgi:hypothetical protein